MFWKKCRALFSPLAVALFIVVFIGNEWKLLEGNAGEFIWEVFLGAMLGALLGVLPILHGDTAKLRFVTQRWLACAVLAAMLIYQYTAMFEGVRIPWLSFLNGASGGARRMILCEATLLGYCALSAVRAQK